MSQCYFKIFQFFIAESSRQYIIVNTVCLTNVTLQLFEELYWREHKKDGSECGIVKRAFGNGLTNFIAFLVQKILQYQFVKNMKIKQPIPFEWPNVAMTFWKVTTLENRKSFENGLYQFYSIFMGSNSPLSCSCLLYCFCRFSEEFPHFKLLYGLCKKMGTPLNGI